LPDVGAFETELFAFLESRHPDVFKGIVEKKQLDDQLKAALDDAVKKFAADFTARRKAAA
jgi:F-type H+/Na+-transporting ATPase subunit alpha